MGGTTLLVAGLAACGGSTTRAAKTYADELFELGTGRIASQSDLTSLGRTPWMTRAGSQAAEATVVESHSAAQRIIDSVPSDVWARLGDEGVLAVCDVVWFYSTYDDADQHADAIWERALARLPDNAAATADDLAETATKLYEARTSGDAAKILGQAIVCQGATPDQPTSPPSWLSELPASP